MIKYRIIQTLYESKKLGHPKCSTEFILKELKIKEKENVSVDKLFDLFNELLESDLIENVETDNIESMYFKITKKGAKMVETFLS